MKGETVADAKTPPEVGRLYRGKNGRVRRVHALVGRHGRTVNPATLDRWPCSGITVEWTTDQRGGPRQGRMFAHNWDQWVDGPAPDTPPPTWQREAPTEPGRYWIRRWLMDPGPWQENPEYQVAEVFNNYEGTHRASIGGQYPHSIPQDTESWLWWPIPLVLPGPPTEDPR